MASTILSVISATFASSSKFQRCTHCYNWYTDPRSGSLEAHVVRSLFLKHCAKHLAKDTCPRCREKLLRLLLVKEKDQEGPSALLRHDQRESSSLALYEAKTAVSSAQGHTCFEAAKRDVKLYQKLLASGAKLPPLTKQFLHGSEDTDILLTLAEDRALFRELQNRGAFRAPGMDRLFRDEAGCRLTDGEIYDIIREYGAIWDLEDGWIKNGLPVSFVIPNGRKTACNGAKGRWNRRYKISGSRPPARMDRGKFKLEPILEVDEEGVADAPWPLRKCIPASHQAAHIDTRRAATPAMGYQTGILHTFQSTGDQMVQRQHQLKDLAGTIRRVGKGSMDLRSRAMSKSLPESGNADSDSYYNGLALHPNTMVFSMPPMEAPRENALHYSAAHTPSSLDVSFGK